MERRQEAFLTDRRGTWFRELVAAASIVASLLFVAYEIRQNTKAATASSIQASAALTTEVFLALAQDRELEGLLLEAQNGARSSDFDTAENFHLQVFIGAGLKQTESRFRQAQLGVVSGDEWFGANNTIFNSLYLREVWPSMRAAQAPDFAEWFEERYGLR